MTSHMVSYDCVEDEVIVTLYKTNLPDPGGVGLFLHTLTIKTRHFRCVMLEKTKQKNETLNQWDHTHRLCLSRSQK